MAHLFGAKPGALFVVAIAAAVCVCTTTAANTRQTRTFDLLTAGIQDIHAAVDAGALSYERLVRLYLNRIDADDRKGPQLRAVIAINPRAEDDARARDVERRTTGRRGPLHGIPIAIKDNIDVQGLPTTGGHRDLGARRRQKTPPWCAGCATPAPSS